MRYGLYDTLFCCFDCQHKFVSWAGMAGDYGKFYFYLTEGVKILPVSNEPHESIFKEVANIIQTVPLLKGLVNRVSSHFPSLSQILLAATFDNTSDSSVCHFTPACPQCGSIRTISLYDERHNMTELELWEPTYIQWARKSKEEKAEMLVQELGLYRISFFTTTSYPCSKLKAE